MSHIEELLAARSLPALGFDGVDPEARRLELIDILSDNIYGRTPDFKSEVSAEMTFKKEGSFGGKGNTFHYNLTATTPGGNFTFPLYLTYPRRMKPDSKVPLIVHISFNMLQPSGAVPAEDILDRGVALARFCYTDVAADRYDDFKEGVAPLFPREKGSKTLWGKIGMWAWAASRSLDFLLTLGLFDTDRIAVCGHSRLGKTALWCGAQDTRFTHVFSNNAGCSGDAITRGKQGERIAFITKTFNYWFCDKYQEYKDDAIADMPFDQHFLMATIAPRKLAVGAASHDIWADPESEYLCCCAASEAWEKRDLVGLVHPDRLSEVGEVFNEGNVAFHQRYGEHAQIRSDWMTYIDFLLK
ncbi:MAG: hypothetical protein IJ493_07620 [Clostridia bacterium]|nr:hypothetical protein [Clostridia bacterium]